MTMTVPKTTGLPSAVMVSVTVVRPGATATQGCGRFGPCFQSSTARELPSRVPRRVAAPGAQMRAPTTTPGVALARVLRPPVPWRPPGGHPDPHLLGRTVGLGHHGHGDHGAGFEHGARLRGGLEDVAG